ncbi:MAG: hypothetical protein Q8936_12050 [Bacillota bacterium]|nr:hypothetical protein [Bacillota bacterium]
MNYESPMIQSLGQEAIDAENQTDAGWLWTYTVVAGALYVVVAAVLVGVEVA